MDKTARSATGRRAVKIHNALNKAELRTLSTVFCWVFTIDITCMLSFC